MNVPQNGLSDLAQQRDRTEGYLRVDPNNKLLLTRAIEFNLALGNTEDAQAHANTALSLFPDDPMLRCLNGHVLTALQKWAEAAAIYAGLLNDVSDPDLAFSLANCQIWQGQHQAALDTMAPFEQTANLPAATVTLLIRAYHHLGNFERAKELIEQNHERLAQDATFLAAASLVFLDAGEVDQAGAFGKAAIALGERPLEAIVTNATLSLGQADSDLAIEQFQEALAINPNEGRSWAGIGQANFLKRDFVNAKMQLERAVKLLPNSIGTWHALGWSHVFTNELPQAERAFKAALEIDRNFAETHGSIATVDAMKGDRSAAEEGIERALRLDPTCLAARFAQMVLGGQAADPERFRALAMRFIAGRKNSFGVELSDMVAQQLAKK